MPVSVFRLRFSGHLLLPVPYAPLTFGSPPHAMGSMLEWVPRSRLNEALGNGIPLWLLERLN